MSKVTKKSKEKAPKKAASSTSTEGKQRKALSDIAASKQAVSDIGVRDELRKDAIVLPKLRGEIAAEEAYERLQEANKEQAKKNYEESQSRLKVVDAANAEGKRTLRQAAGNVAVTEDEVWVVDNLEDTYPEVSYGGISYYLKPGENEIKPLVPGHTSKSVAWHIASSISGVTIKEKDSKKKAAKDEDSVPLSGSVISGVPDHIAAKLQGVSNPPAHERLQPTPIPTDVDKYGAATIAEMQKEHFKALKGETADGKEYAGKVAKGPKREGAKRRIAEEE